MDRRPSRRRHGLVLRLSHELRLGHPAVYIDLEDHPPADLGLGAEKLHQDGGDPARGELMAVNSSLDDALLQSALTSDDGKEEKRKDQN